MEKFSRFTILAVALVTPLSAIASSAKALRKELNSPILFTKRGNYQGIHIYDTCYQWHPGGGIYILENPADPPETHRVRAVIDATTKETLGEGMYFDPDLLHDAKKVLFCFKGEPKGSSSIYEIGIDGTGLRRITNPRADYLPDENGQCKSVYHGVHGSLGAAQDLMPAYLPDGRIVFTTMRHNGLVPCANSGVANTSNKHYQKMLNIIMQGRKMVLATPRLDMPGGELLAIAGRHRNIYPVRIPEKLPDITAEQGSTGEVVLRWGLTAHTWGLTAEIHRGTKSDFKLSDETKIARTELGNYYDRSVLPTGGHYYAVVFDNGEMRSEAIRVEVETEAQRVVPPGRGIGH